MTSVALTHMGRGKGPFSNLGRSVCTRQHWPKGRAFCRYPESMSDDFLHISE